MMPNHSRTTLFSNEESSVKPPRMQSNQHQAHGAATGLIEDDICRWREAQASQTLRRSKAHEQAIDSEESTTGRDKGKGGLPALESADKRSKLDGKSDPYRKNTKQVCAHGLPAQGCN